MDIVFFRLFALSAMSLSIVAAQTAPQSEGGQPEEAPVESVHAAQPGNGARLQPDEDDPMVVRAKQNVEQIRKLVGMGALPAMRLNKAQEEVQDALDMSLLKQNLYNPQLLPEQIDQLVYLAQKMVARRQHSMDETQQLVDAGVISRSEAQATASDMARAQTELELARARAKLIEQIAESVHREKNMASIETEAQSHPEWNGKVYMKYDGNGVFTPQELLGVEGAFAGKFAKALPISADGETAVHRSLGFDHRGRVDVAVNPDTPEGIWLMHYLESKRIPYFAFRMAVPGKATGAHIHMGPQSIRLAF